MSGKLQLNKEQKKAVEHGQGPLLIIAGAGTGKTTVITERIKYLILEKGILPHEVLALTFTEKASREMEERVDIAMPYGYTQMWISTFHSFCDRILRQDAIQIGLDPHYRLATEAESVRFIRSNLFEFNLKYFRPLGNPNKFLRGLLEHFSRLKDEDISPLDYIKWVKNSKHQARSTKVEKEKWVELAGAYRKYEELKVKEGIMDFSDLISNTLKLFRTRKNVLGEYQKQFKHILIDEFQDTNIAQYELVKLLASPSEESNLTVVGDDSQSVYKFRGAAISNIIYFMQDYKNAAQITLTKNYRSTQKILDSAYKLIRHNNPDTLEAKLGIDKKLLNTKKEEGGNPEFILKDRVEDEAEEVVKIILKETKAGRKFSDFAILVRANNHSEPFVRALSRNNIPYQFLGPGQLFRQEEIKEIIAYLKVLYDFEDSGAFYKVLASEHFDIDGRDLASVTNYARKYGTSLFEAAEKADDIFLSEEGRRKISFIVQMVYKHLKRVPKETAGQIAYYYLEDSGVVKTLIEARNAKDEKKAQNIARFFDKLKTYEVEHEDASIFAVVDWIELSIELGESPLAANLDWTKENAVNILTAHSAKGLEFPVVFVVNLVSERFPTRERREQIPIPEELIKEVLPVGDHHLQEERRLFYVAATRAQDELYLTAANYYGEGKREKKISPFVFEALGEKAIRMSGNQDVRQLSILDFAPTNGKGLPTTDYRLQPINYLSYSQIDTFRFCPMHYKLRYILNVPTKPTAALSFGDTMHKTLKGFTEGLKKDPKIGEKEIFELFEQNWAREGYGKKSYEEAMKKRGREYLAAYLKSELHNPLKPPLVEELPFIFPITKDLKLGGRIDRIDKTEEGIEIIDYKTTDLLEKNLPSQKELEKNLQLSFYALAAANVHTPTFQDIENDTLSLYFFDKGAKVSTQRSKKDLEKATEEIIKAKREIENSDFACSGNFWCKDCEYKLFCEAAP